MKYIKYTTIIPKKIDNILTILSIKKDCTKAEIVRNAIVIYNKLCTDLQDQNNKLYIMNTETGSTKEIIIV